MPWSFKTAGATPGLLMEEGGIKLTTCPVCAFRCVIHAEALQSLKTADAW